jgi:putative ABC transport system ATP-binding protein
MLNVQGLSKQYHAANFTQSIFNDLSLHIQQSEVCALLGASGSGKTTLLNLLSGIDDPDAGSVIINDTNIHTLQEPHRTLFRRQHIGFVFQFFNLIPTLTVSENVALPMELLGQTDKQIQQRVDYLLERVGLGNMQQRYPDSLSGGEQQRTAVARALSHQPTLLLADEPTGNLDEETGRQVIDLLTELARDQHTTMLIVTHSHSVAQSADRILQLKQGILNEQ